VQTAPLTLQLPARVGHCALFVQRLPCTLHVPVSTQLALAMHDEPSRLQLPASVGQLAFAVHAAPDTLQAPAIVGHCPSFAHTLP